MKIIIKVALIALVAVAVFTTCDTPMGMGNPIDWEAPVLKMDPIPNPFYVRKARDGSLPVLAGTVTDNIGVDRVIYINVATGEELFPVIRNGNNWKVELSFTEAQNGEKIVTQVIAYDKMGNSDAGSMAFATLIIDIREPIIEYIDIKRTDSRMADIETYSALKALERTDAKGERKADLFRYQNGWFYINAIVSDKETKVKVISLEIYDTREEGNTLVHTLLLSLDVDSDYTPYFPRWTVKEEDIINAGVTRIRDDYKTNYYDNKERYYYQVVIKALDMSENESGILEEDEGYICMWAKSDEPKGIVDPGIGTIVSRGTPLPVDFYDDENLLWAFTGMVTEDQWYGTAPVADGDLRIPSGTDEAKLSWLKEKLTGVAGESTVINNAAATPIYNWRYDKYTQDTGKDAQILEQIGTSNIDEKLVYVPTGNMESDYGNYVLFTLVADKKLSPHTGNGPEWTNKNIWAGRAEYVQVIDENAPLIVFDTTAGCPEENTFPDPLKDEDGKSKDTAKEQKYFEIVGYTLRENASGLNGVRKFRMAWIPYNMPEGPDKYIPEVQAALRSDTFAGMPQNVQYWNFNPNTPVSGEGEFEDQGDEKIPSDADLKPGESQSVYKKQSFKLRFSVMGDADELKPLEYNNFTYRGSLENETKLFIFYAMDNMGHEVYRQLRLLGYREEPDLTVYDITNRIETMEAGYPNPTENGNTDLSSGSPTDDYYDLLKTYNQTPAVYSAIKTAATNPPGLTDDDIKTIPFQIYPRNTILKYFVKSDNSGKIPIETITMQDITFKGRNDAPFVGSGYNDGDTALSFSEFYPDVTQRTFLFIAKDKLGNEKQIQRSIAVTNAARLERITTTTQTGTYGIGTKITLRAEFSGLIYIKSGAPQLYVRYKKNNVMTYEPLNLKSTPTYDNPATALEFEFEVKENYTGTLETMYDNAAYFTDYIDLHPITLEGAEIMDYNRQDSAFIPGYTSNSVTMPNWTTNVNTLQSKKTISMDGIRPTITSTVWGGKDVSGDGRYFKNGETITLTVTSDKEIRASGNSTFQYYIRDRVTGGTIRGPYSADFKYQRPGNDKHVLIYSLTVTNANCPYDGRFVDVTLNTSGTSDTDSYIGIVDNVGNSVVKPAALLPQNTNPTVINVKQTKPAAPAATLTNDNAGYTTDTLFTAATRDYYNGPISFKIPDATGNFATWEETKQYSTDGGILWITGASGSVSDSGTYTLQARYLDRAGNEGEVRSKKVNINDTFPSLISVNTVQANGTYKKDGKLTFNLNFADTVTVKTPASVSITLKNRAAATTSANEYTITLSAAQTNVATVVFDWPKIEDKEMREGLYISSMTLSGLEDKYGIQGPTTAITGNYNGTNFTGHAVVNNCANLTAGVIVDAINPSIDTTKTDKGRTPQKTDTGVTVSGNNLVKTLTLTFNEPVMRGSGVITVRPRGEYAIPAVLEDTGYYLGYTSNGQPTGGTEGESQLVPTKFQTAGTNRTYISSFYDIYNSISSTDRTNLTAGSSMSDLTLNARTGQSTGPYKKMTQGLVTGYGYLANYTGTAVANGYNSPNANVYTALIPDTATKWVLDYQYPISVPSGNTTALNNQRNVVDKIRIALTNAKWRWQEIDVVTATVSGNTVTINLNEPLLKGLAWDVYYPAGTFTDLAGNPAPGSGTTATNATDWTNSDYYFTSPGVQAPVIRVNRKSSDSRTSDWQNKKSVDTVTDTDSWNTNTIVASDSNGWGSGNFNYIHYRVETESSVVGGTVTALVYKGTADSANRTAAKGSFTGTDAVQTTNYTPAAATVTGGDNIVAGNYTGFASRTWAQAAEATAGTWVTPNIVFRSQVNPNSQTYTVVTKNGTPEARTSTNTTATYGTFPQTTVYYPLRMYKSYNRDLTAAELGLPNASASVTLTSASLSTADDTKNQGFLSFDSYEASKSYVVGTASCNGVSNKGVEGVFRTVIMLNHSFSRPANFIAIEGSNIKNGMPSVAGFPVRDADEYDCRFFKVCFDVSPTGSVRSQFYWVSTEIVCEWYFIAWGGGTTNSTNNNGTHMNWGEVNNYMMVGYGDLTYAYNMHASSQYQPSANQP